MQKPNYAIITLAVFFAVIVGILGGALMGGLAGYYVVESMAPSQAGAIATPAVSTNANPSNLQAAPPAPTNLTLKEDSAVIDAVRQAKPAVVTIINDMQPHGGFFGSPTITASGSGVIVDSRGYIVTNQHVIDGEKDLQVIYADGTKVAATVVGADTASDIAVLKVDGQVPAVAQFGDSNNLEPGQVAIAIGSPLGDFRGTVTVGIVSALNRRVGRQQGLIQTDAAINNGNSGGPLINSLGQVVGINTLVVRSTNEGNVAEGLGFAIPSNVVRDILGQLIAKGSVERPYIGVSYQEVDPQLADQLNLKSTNGVVVTTVDQNSPAGKVGLRENDIILAIDASKLDSDHSLQSLLFSHKAGDTVTLTVLRDGKQISVPLTLVLQACGAGHAMIHPPGSTQMVDHKRRRNGQHTPMVGNGRLSRRIDLDHLQSCPQLALQCVKRRLLRRPARHASRRRKIQDRRPTSVQ
jgi:S1-C subfamily serine protease